METNMTEKLHECEGHLPQGGYGEAIDACNEKPDGTLWAGNTEYGSQVAFCPYCGFKARVAPLVRAPWPISSGDQR